METTIRRTYRRIIITTILILFSLCSLSQNNAPNDIPFQSYDKKLNPDHKLHFLVGATASAMAYDFTYRKTGNKNKAFWNGVTASIAAGIVKESIDAAVRDAELSKNDLFSAVLGGLTAGITINILNKPKTNYRKLDKKLGGYYYEKKHKNINDDVVRSYRKHQRKQSRKERRLNKKDI